jgi:hypothetical protein
MKKSDELWLSKTLYSIYGFKSFKVIDVINETESGICVFWHKGNKEIWLPKSHILRSKPNYD